MNTTPEQVRARILLRQIWGTPGLSMSTEQHREIANFCAFAASDSPIEACLKTVGIWEAYVVAGRPTWAAFRSWLNQVCPEEVA